MNGLLLHPAKAWFFLLAHLILVGSGRAQSQADWLAAPAVVAEKAVPHGSSPVALELGEFTWVVFSSPDLQEASRVRRQYRGRSFGSALLAVGLNEKIRYRVVLGRFASLQEAREARPLLPAWVPADTWLLRITNVVRVVPEAESSEPGVSASPDALHDDKPRMVAKLDSLAPVRPSDALAGPLPPNPKGETRAAPEDQSETAKRDVPSFLDHFDLQMRLSNIYDSNVDHDEEHLQSYGLVPGLRLRYRNRLSDPLLTVVYIVARHSYTNTEKWDRISNKIQVAFEPEFTDWLHGETVAAISLRGSSEDRDVSDQYILTQELEYRLTRDNRFQLYGTLRWKRFPENANLNAFKPHVGGRFERRLPGGRRWEIGIRYELKRAQSTRRNYARWIFDTEYRLPVFSAQDQLKIEVKYRRKLYDERFVEIEDEDFLRRDQRWVLGATWRHTLLRGFHVTLDYKFEMRDSIDPEKWFNAHLLGLALAYDL